MQLVIVVLYLNCSCHDLLFTPPQVTERAGQNARHSQQHCKGCAKDVHAQVPIHVKMVSVELLIQTNPYHPREQKERKLRVAKNKVRGGSQ